MAAQERRAALHQHGRACSCTKNCNNRHATTSRKTNQLETGDSEQLTRGQLTKVKKRLNYEHKKRKSRHAKTIKFTATPARQTPTQDQ